MPNNPHSDSSFLSSIIRSSDDAIEALTLDGMVLVWNRGSEEIYGYSESDMKGKSVLTVYPESKINELKSIIAKVKEGAHVAPYMTQRIRKDGTRIEVVVSASPVKDETDAVVGVSIISRPFAGQERVDQYARSLIEASLDPLVTISAAGKITDVNEATIQVTGVSRADLIGSDFSIYFTEPNKALEGYQLAFSKGRVTDYPLTIRRKDGALIDVRYNASVYKDEEGNVLGVFAAARDITAQKQASRYARSLIDASLDPLLTISTEGKITDVNTATVNVTGATREELVGADFFNYFTEPEKAREGYQRVFKEGSVTDYPLTIRNKSGRLIDVLYNASVYKDEAGNVLGVFAAARDVTTSKQALYYARSVIEAGLDPMITISPEGKITDVNEATVKITGVTRELLIGSDFINFFTDPEEARQGNDQVFKEGFIREYPLVVRHATNKLTDVLYNASVYKDNKGNVFGVIAAMRDVTAQKIVENKLHETSAYAQSLVESSLDPLFVISPEGKITGVNHATEKMTGVTREWLIDTDFSSYFSEPRKARDGYRQVLKKGEVRDYPLAIHDSSGKITDVSFNASVYKDALGAVRGIFAVARDVTETKKVSKYARSLIEASLDPLVTISPEGKITDVNEATMRVTGHSREKLIGTDFSDYFSEPKKAQEGYTQVFKLGSVIDYPLTIKADDGRLTDVLYNASVYKDDSGKVLGVFAAARDNTRAKQFADQLAETNRDLEAFTNYASHDLRAPLVAIKGFAQILSDEHSKLLNEEGRGMVSSIIERATHMGKLISDLLEFSRVGRHVIKKENLNSKDLATAIFEELKLANPKRNIEFNIGPIDNAFADPALIRQVWMNLLSNAVKYTNKRPIASIDVSSKEEDGFIVYTIKDNGAGFDMKYYDKLFGVFQRLHSNDEFEGTGVGLSISQRIVNKHDGKIWAEGKVGEGATFSFSLPSGKLKK